MARSSRKLSHLLQYAALVCLGLLLRTLPIDLSSRAMGGFWRTIGPRSRRQGRVLRNLRIAFPGLEENAHAAIARRQWDNLGRTFAESFQIDRILADPSRIVIRDEVGLRARLAGSGRGLVVVSLHTANWEVAGVAVHGVLPVAGLYQRLTNPLADSYVRTMRERVFTAGLFAKGPETVGRITRLVRSGHAVAMLADLRERRGRPVVFFGRETTANPFPAMLARRLGVPVLAGRAIRGMDARFVLEGVEIPVPMTDNVGDDVAVLTQAIQDQFEAWVRERPGEWMWVHDRWKETRETSGPERPART